MIITARKEDYTDRSYTSSRLTTDDKQEITFGHIDVRAKLPTEQPYPFNAPQYLLINLAVGGNWPGSPDRTTQFPQELLVDYVRVYGLKE